MLKIRSLDVAYGGLKALSGVSLDVEEGQLVAVVGPNGAGKTTLFKTISGVVTPLAGEIVYKGRSLLAVPPYERAKLGIAHVPEGRQVFASMTVMENLEMGAYARRDRRRRPELLLSVIEIFPILAERSAQPAGTLSGGEQQMLAIGRCLMGMPELVMFDEPSLGLAPALVQTVLATIRDLNREGLTCVLVEQNVAVSLRLANRAYVLENGRITLAGSGAELLADDRVRQAYLGL